MSSTRRRTSVLSVLALVLGLLPLTPVIPVLAADAPGDVVVSQVYGGGGNSGAEYTNDFVELYNRGGTAVDLTGWSVQYASSAGTSWQVTALSGVIEPGQYFLVQQAAGSGGTTPLPTPDATGSISMSGTNGKVALAATTTALTGTCPLELTADFVGYGSANCHEGSAATGVLANTTAALRLDAGCVDTDDNGADFEVVAPAPRNSASAIHECAPSSGGTSLVISQVYGGGGNAGAVFTNDFVEIFNPTDSSIDLSGWSVQYASSAGTSWQVTALSGVIQPGQYFLVQQAAGSGGTTPLPAPDATGSISMSGTNGKVALAATTTALTGTCPLDLTADFVGYGSANCFEGSASAAALSNTTAALRLEGGCVDTDDNAADFETVTPLPRNSASPVNDCSGGPDPVAALVISQVYGGGGNAGATLKQDFVEIFNPTDSAVDLTGWSVQYGSATGSTWQVTALSGAIASGGYYLVGQAPGSGGTVDLPAPDASGSIAMAGAAGKVALVADAAALDVDCAAWLESSVDFVGYGGTANCVEGSGPTANLSNTTAGLRLEGGCVDTDDNAADFETGTPEPRNSASPATDCDAPPPRVCPLATEVTLISMAQGSGDASPCDGETITIEGVVVGDYEGPSANLRGFYVQEEDADQDADDATSEGIFVFHGSQDLVQLGDLVRVTGTVDEFQDQTQLGFPDSLEILAYGQTVTPEQVTMPFSDATYLERYEGMLVQFTETLYVTEFFQLGRFGQIVMSSEARLAQPTNVVEPGPEAVALQAANNLNRLIVDDHLNNQNPDPIVFGRGGNPLTAANTLRGGDTLTGVVGVMTYTWAGDSASGNAYRLRPVDEGAVFDFQAANPRPTARPGVGGSLSVASFNVLNYFLTLDDGGADCGPVGHAQECRGAEDSIEFDRQRTKLLAALAELDVDVLALMELENTPGVEPVADLVAGLNTMVGAGTYGYVDTGVIGTDVIRTGLIYRTDAVAEAGNFAILDSSVDGRFDDDLNRPTLAQSFEDLATGATVTVAVNHLKSKGCGGATGADADQGDGQGCWSPARTAAAEAMVDWLAGHPTGVVDDDVLITGDLNSYAKEDPIDVFTAAGYVDLHSHFGGEDAYGYVFDGQWGYLDHALASPSLFAQVTGAESYHINADEPSVLDFNTNFKSDNQIDILFAPDEFRTSDHDPIVIGLELDVPLPEWSPTEVYNTGDRVLYNGKVYEALWWTRNQAPGSPYGPWQEIAENADGMAIWTPSRIFNAGDRVEHDGKVYEALWWTRNQEPGSPYGPWQEMAETEDGIPIWTASRVFNAGEIVFHNGNLYQARWWNRNVKPTGSGPWRLFG